MDDIQRYAKKHCCNFYGQDKCLLEPDGQLTCVFFRGDDKARCKFWFEEAVLPMDEALEARYQRERVADSDGHTAACTRCHSEYKPKSNRQRYCADCKTIVSREAAKESMRRKRSRVEC